VPSALEEVIPFSLLRDGEFYQGVGWDANIARWSADERRFWCWDEDRIKRSVYARVCGPMAFVPTGIADWYDVVCHFG
jgi:hypothetical protein